MSDIALFELLAAICALVAAVFIFDQHLHRPRPFKLMWSLGLLFYGIAAAAAFAGAIDHWTVLEYKLWYYFGGIMTAAFLGLGSCFLLAPRRVAQGFAAVMIILAVYAAVRIALYPVPADVAAQIASVPFSEVTNVSKLPVFPGDLTDNFDFARFLRQKEWQNDPFARSYPLREVWGLAVMARPAPGAPTFVDAAEAYRYWPAIAGAVRAYARDHHGRELLMAADGVYPGVDVHSVGLREDNADGPEGALVTYVHLAGDEHLDGMYSFQNAFLGLKVRAQAFAPGAPVVVYLDGFWNKYNFLPPSEQADYWRMYSAEAYANGVFLAFHLKGVPGTGAPLSVATPVMAAYKTLAAFYRAHAAAYHGVVRSVTPLPPLPRVTVAIADRLDGAAGAVVQRYVHVVNHQYSRAFVPQPNLAVTFASPSRPSAITLASPDQPADLAAYPFTYDELDGATTVVLPSLVSYTLIEISY